MRVLLFITLLVAALLFASGWENPIATPAMTTVVDGMGRTVTLPATPHRIVSIFASNTELLYAVGAGPDIVAIEEKTVYPPAVASLPRIGGRLGFSVEHIAATRPDLVVLTTARHAAGNLLHPLQVAGIPALVLQHQDVDTIFHNLGLLGQVTGRTQDAALAIARLRQRLLAVQQRVGQATPVRCYLETGSAGAGGHHTVVPGTYTADALALAGGSSVFPDLRLSLPVTGEAVLLADPEVIIVCGGQREIAALCQRPGWQHLSAVRHGRVYAVPRAWLLIPGPRIVDGVEALADCLHPR